MEKDKDSFLAALQREILRHNFRYIRGQTITWRMTSSQRSWTEYEKGPDQRPAGKQNLTRNTGTPDREKWGLVSTSISPGGVQKSLCRILEPPRAMR
jgi:hypothetical protein